MKNFSLNKTIVAFLIMGSMLAPHFAHADITSNLIGWWKFDEGSGTNAADSSGNANTGSLVSGATWAAGKIGPFSVDTSSTFGQVNISAVTIGSSWTASAWTFFPLVGSSYKALFKDSVSGNYQVIVDPSNNLGTLSGGFSSSGHSVGSLTGWHLITAVGSGGNTIFYVDGVSVGTASTEVTNPINVMGNDGGFQWGVFDDVRIYNRALSAADVKELAGLDANLFGWWKFDEGSGTTAADSSGNGNTATLSGTTLPSWTTGKIGPFAVNNTVGNGGVGGYVTTANATAHDHEDLTWSSWIYPTDLSGQGGVNVFIQGGSSGWGQFYVSSSGFLTFGDRQTTDHQYTGATIPLNTWTHVVVTCHDTIGSADVVTLYVNGAQVKQDTGGSGDLYCFDNTPEQINIGGIGSGNFGFTGYIDDVREYYGRILTSGDVAALYALGTPPPPPTLLKSFIWKIGRSFSIKVGRSFNIR